ncbi:MAG: hypothetical protein ACK46C_11355, partial [Flavobacteriales bacterium]
MKTFTSLRSVFLIASLSILARPAAHAQGQPNGQLDDLFELTTPMPLDFIMPDSTRLRSDVY